MIFATVGTTSFDPLIKKIDDFVLTGKINEEVIAQIGEGKYSPRHINHFRYVKSLDNIIDKARIVITTGGAGTVFECLAKNKNIISIENTKVSGSHQKELLYKLHKDGHIIWCRNMDKIPNYIEWFDNHSLNPFIPEILDINLIILSMFAEDEKVPKWKIWRR